MLPPSSQHRSVALSPKLHSTASGTQLQVYLMAHVLGRGTWPTRKYACFVLMISTALMKHSLYFSCLHAHKHGKDDKEKEHFTNFGLHIIQTKLSLGKNKE